MKLSPITHSPESDAVSTSGERYKFLVEHSGEIISTHRPGDWAYTSMNQALESMSGFTPAELMGRPAYDLFHPDDAEAMKNKLIPAIYHHGVRTFRYRSLLKAGGYTWLESTHRSVRDEAGELVEIVAVTRDISEQVKIEEVNRRLAQVVEASFALILFCDRQHRVSYMNEATNKVLNAGRLGQRPALKDLIGLESYKTIVAKVFSESDRKGSWKGALRLRVPQTSERYLLLEEVFANSREDLGKEGNYYSLIVRDITEQKMIEKKVRDHQSELIHASRLMTMGEMASGLAHEINQPLATTLNYARGAIRKMDDQQPLSGESVRSVFEMIVKQAQHAASIVKRLRSLVKKTPYQRAEFSMQSVIREVELLLSHDLWSQGVSLAYDLPAADIMVLGDRIQIEQVLINLIRNSMDAYLEVRSSQEAECLVMIELEESDKHVIVTLKDSAGGIVDTIGKSLFEPYVTSKDNGLGMGLSISRSIIEAHGGQITVTSDHIKSTVFTLRFPRIAHKEFS